MQMPAAARELLKRLDDSSDAVRIATCGALAAVLSPEAATVDAALLHTLAVHLDDANAAVAEAMCGVLLVCSQRQSDLVLAELPAACKVHRSQELCSRILATCRQS